MRGVAVQRTAWSIAAALLTIVPLSARAQTDNQTVLWVHADIPGASTSDEAARLLTALEAMGLLESPSLQAPAAVLASAILADGEWTAAITRIEELGVEFRIDAVVEISCVDPEPVEAAVVALLARHAGAPPAATWEPSPLANGARRLTHDDLPDWRSVMVLSLDDRLVVGTSTSAVQRWLDASRARTPTRLERFRASMQSPVAFEAFIDLNALRRGIPSRFVHGQWNRILASLSLANTRDAWCRAVTIEPPSVRITGVGPEKVYRGPSLLRVEAAGTSRARSPEEVERVDATESVWPSRSIHMPPPSASLAIVARVEPESFVGGLLRLHAARLDERERDRFARMVWGWSEEHGSRQRRLLRSLSAWTVVTADTDRRLPVMFTELRPAVNIDRVASDLGILLEVSGLGTAGDASDLWIIGPHDDAGSLIPLLHVAIARAPQPAILVWGFDHDAVLNARQSLDAP